MYQQQRRLYPIFDITLHILSTSLSRIKFDFKARSLFINVTSDPLSSKALVFTDLFPFLIITGTICNNVLTLSVLLKAFWLLKLAPGIPELAVLGAKLPVLGAALPVHYPSVTRALSVLECLHHFLLKSQNS